MSALSKDQLESLLMPYLAEAPDIPAATSGVELHTVYQKLSAYLDLIIRWNERTNLTAIRDVQSIATRHLGESLFAARCLQAVGGAEGRLLDFGSGAGLPGIPMQVWIPGLSVTLAESQGKKAAFLREAVRLLGLHAEVWSSRVEDMPLVRRFEVVAMRAVDSPEAARAAAWNRVTQGGWLVEIVAGQAGGTEREWATPGLDRGFVKFSQRA